MIKEKKCRYNSGDGTQLTGILTAPVAPEGSVLLCHGIAVDKNEWNDFYVEVARRLYENTFASLRFDFRGHGESAGRPEDITVAGEALDVAASASKLIECVGGRISLVGTSFGAGPAIFYVKKNPELVKCLVLLCPVLDYVGTFLEPETPWAKEIFCEEGFRQLEETGHIALDEGFEVSRRLIEEFKVVKPWEVLSRVPCPVLTMHGDRDSMVPFRVSEEHGRPNADSEFVRVEGADHGFVEFGDEDGVWAESKANRGFVIQRVSDWVERWNSVQ
ncbi:MAG: alpha/beta hydrolase [Planctomycetota bacterium]